MLFPFRDIAELKYEKADCCVLLDDLLIHMSLRSTY